MFAFLNSKIQVVDSAIFEPGDHLPSKLSNVAPTKVPTSERHLLSTEYGYLINELLQSPQGVIDSVMKLLKQALELDTGDFDAVTTDIVLYLLRFATRMENYISFVVKCANSSSVNMPLHNVHISPLKYDILSRGLVAISTLLRYQFVAQLSGWVCRLYSSSNVDNVDETTKAASSIHSHILLVHRNVHHFSHETAQQFLSSLIFITTRHSWNLNILPIPETHLFEVLQVCQRSVIKCLRESPKSMFNTILESSVATTTQTTKSSARQWAFVAGPRSTGRFTVETVPTDPGKNFC